MKAIKYIFSVIAVLLTITTCNINSMTRTVPDTARVSANAIHPLPDINTNEPVLVWSASVRNIAADSTPAIFYSPHQDDETIGMGASIAEQVRLGRPVFVVLLTNGHNLNMLTFLQSLSDHASMQDVADARNNEFIAACKALGADRIYIANGGKGYDEKASLPDLTLRFKTTMIYFSRLFPNAFQHTLSGNCDSFNPNCDKMPAHQAAASAMHELYNAGMITHCILFRAYCYYRNSPKCDRSCNWLKPVNQADKSRRQRAINEYKLVDEKNHRYGLAYWHSVDVLFDNSWDSDYEEVDSMKNDY